jgi:AcrR family transcriptional regulator
VPTAAQIAERAGYSVRSIFERFPDLHALRLAATDFAIAEGTGLNPLPSNDADRMTRIRQQTEARARGCERWLPLWRVLNANKRDSPELQKRIGLVRQLILRRIELVFEAELAMLSQSERRKTVLALEALVDFESWARMRELYSLSHEEACNVWIYAIDRLLPAQPAG